MSITTIMLVDTNAVIWWIRRQSGRMTPKALVAIENPDDLVVSAVAVLEIAIKRSVSKLEMPPDLLERIAASGISLLPVTPQHADRVADLPLHHRDPFDRLLVAQAQLEGLPILSADPLLRLYDVEVVW